MFRLRLLVIILFSGLCGCTSSTNDESLPTLLAIDSTQPTSTLEPPQVLQFWQPATDEIDDLTVDTWLFEAQAEDEITLRAIGRGVEVTLELIDTRGQTLQTGRTIQTTLPASGQYTVYVEADAGGTYELGLSYSGQPNPSEIAPTPLPVIVGIPTPLPISADLGTFIAELDNGQTLAGQLSAADNRHVYTFLGETEQYLTVETVRVSGEFDPFVTLYSVDGLPLAVDANSGINASGILRNIRLNSQGFYTIQVDGRGGSGVYSVKLAFSEQPVPVTPTVIFVSTPTRVAPILTPIYPTAVFGERLANHQPVIGQLETSSDVQRHSFEAFAGEVITLGVIPAVESGLIPRVELYDPDGVPVAVVSGLTSPTSREALIPTYAAAISGPYTAFITAEGETFGEYLISYGAGSTYQDRMLGEALFDQQKEGVFDRQGTRHVWYAHLRQGDVITAAVQVTTGALDPILELVSETGELLGLDNRSGGVGKPLLNGVTIPRTGLYYLRVRASQFDRLGGYSLIWRYVDVAPTVTPPQGLTRVLSITDTITENAYLFYPFQGRAGQTLRISVVAEFGNSLDPVVALLDADAAILVEGDDSENSLNPQVYVAIPADGTYTVRVNGYLSAGKFDLIVEELVPISP